MVYNSVITIRTNEDTQFCESHNITTHRLLHVSAPHNRNQGPHNCIDQLLINMQELVCCNIMTYIKLCEFFSSNCTGVLISP